MKEQYRSIDSVLDDFSKSYNELKDLKNNLTSALYGKIRIVTDDEADAVALKVITDSEYVNLLTSAVRSENPISALHIYESCIDELGGAISAKEKTVEKLSERILFQDDDSPEVKIAKKKKSAYLEDIDTLHKRMEFCLKRFYCLRQSVVSKVCAYSASVASSFDNTPNGIAEMYIKKYSLPIERLKGVDNTLMKG